LTSLGQTEEVRVGPSASAVGAALFEVPLPGASSCISQSVKRSDARPHQWPMGMRRTWPWCLECAPRLGAGLV